MHTAKAKDVDLLRYFAEDVSESNCKIYHLLTASALDTPPTHTTQHGTLHPPSPLTAGKPHLRPHSARRRRVTARGSGIPHQERWVSSVQSDLRRRRTARAVPHMHGAQSTHLASS